MYHNLSTYLQYLNHSTFYLVGISKVRGKEPMGTVFMGIMQPRFGCSLLTLILIILTVTLVACCVTKCQEVPIRLAQIWHSIFYDFMRASLSNQLVRWRSRKPATASVVSRMNSRSSVSIVSVAWW